MPAIPNTPSASTPSPDTPSRSLTRKEAAAYLAISEAFLKKLDLAGRGPTAIRIGRRWTYLLPDLDAFREAHRTPAPAQPEVQAEVTA